MCIFICCIKCCIYLTPTYKHFCFFFNSCVRVSKLIFSNLLIIKLFYEVIKPLVPSNLFLISLTFVLRADLVVRLVMSGILHLISRSFVLRAAFVSRLVISVIFFSMSLAFELRVAVVPKQLY